VSNIFGCNIQKDDFGTVPREKLYEVFAKLFAGLSGQTAEVKEEDHGTHIRITVEFKP
jgi:hypothetical protein